MKLSKEGHIYNENDKNQYISKSFQSNCQKHSSKTFVKECIQKELLKQLVEKVFTLKIIEKKPKETKWIKKSFSYKQTKNT